jgi:signal transduction histidine kinase
VRVLHDFIAVHRDEIIRRCRAKVAVRSIPLPTVAEMDQGVPVFLDHVMDALRSRDVTSPEIGRSAITRGQDLLGQGFTVSQVVHDFGDVCEVITELARELDAPIGPEDFRTLNRWLDEAIADAVSQYGRGRTQPGVEGQSASGTERLGFFAHELRNLLNTALMAYEVLKRGNLGVAGSTGAVLHRSLLASHSLVARSLAEVRLTQGIQNREPFLLAGFIDDLVSASALDANARGVRLVVEPVEDGLVVAADKQVLSAVVANLLQNAIKFTRPATTVTVRVAPSPDRVLIEIEDECGGLPGGDAAELFRPFEQRGADRTGMGLGLAFSRWGAEANDGLLYARSLPERGCVFTVDLPRQPVSAVAAARV